MPTIDALLTSLDQFWQQQKIPHGPPVSESELNDFETRYGVRLPADLRAYFLTLNGMRHDGVDDELVSFWPLEKIEPNIGNETSQVAAGRWDFPFADYSIRVHEYAIRLSSNADDPTPVSVTYDPSPVQVAPTFSAFLEGYLTRDQGVLFPEPSQEWFEKYAQPGLPPEQFLQRWLRRLGG